MIFNKTFKGINFKYLFGDFPEMSDITDDVRKQNSSKYFTGGVRINNGMYRTKKETEKYINKSLKRKLP